MGLDKNTVLGPLTTKRLEEVKNLAEKTKMKVLKFYLRKKTSGFNKGYFYEPTIFDNVKDDFTIKQEPLTFGSYTFF